MKDLQSRSLPVTTVLPQPPLTDLAALPPSEPLPKISFLSFEVGDIALFLSTKYHELFSPHPLFSLVSPMYISPFHMENVLIAICPKIL